MGLISKYKKVISLSLLLTLMLIPVRAVAAEITAIDFLGNPIGQVISTGAVINSEGSNIGSITADSLVINADGEIIGGVVPQGVAIGNDNRFLGKVFSDGFVRNFSGKMLGKTLPSGLVIDDKGSVIGSVLYPGLIYSSEGNTIGRFTGGGDYTNLEGKKIGFVSANGYAYRKTGEEYVLDGRLISSKMVVSDEGKFLGSLAPTGRIMDFEAKDIGSIHANGFAYNNMGKIMGSLVTTKYAFNQIGKYIGIVTYNGEVKNGESSVGFYRPDGNIVNSNGEVFGYALDIASTANDNFGQYLGYLIPKGQIVRGNEVVGILGAKGYVYDKSGNKIGSINSIGPVYDVLSHIKGQALRNGTVISLGGSQIGLMKGNLAFDSNGTLIGGTLGGIVAYRDNNAALGVANIDAAVKSGSEDIRISPFGYVYDKDGKIVGGNLIMNAVYGINGLLYSYINPNGGLYRAISETILSQGGILYSKKGYLGQIIEPLYIKSFAGENLGRITQSNILMNKKGEVAYKALPGGYVVESKDVNSNTISPIKGYYGNKRIALNISGDLIGYTDSEGEIIGLNNKKYGNVIYNDYVVDNNGIINGKTIPFAPVINEKCNPIGVINGKGDIINNRDVIIGHVLPNGQAVSDVGSYIGYSLFNEGLIDYDGNFIGTVNNGIGIDSEGRVLGCVNKHGLITDNGGQERYGLIVPAPVIDFEDNIIGNILVNGEVINAKGQIIGYVQPDGNVVSKTKKNLGNAMHYQVAYDNDNKFLGMVQNSGLVTDSSGKSVGQVHFDGGVYNKDGTQIGYALYDFYVYDENFVTYGYLAKDGTVLSVVGSKLGQVDHGFVLDRKRQVVARGNRDYIVRDLSNNVVGQLQMDGSVTDVNGENIGYLSDTGSVRDVNGNEIARAMPLQYYVAGEQDVEYVEQGDKKPGFRPDFGDRVRVNEISTPGLRKYTKEDTKTPGTAVQQRYGDKIVGIALSPEGEIIGNIYEDDSVKDDDGNQIGFRTPGGVIVDMNYTPIGIEEVKHTSASEMFIPENAFGNGNAYGIGTQPSNLGPGGGYGQGERYDPIRARALAQLQARRRSSMGYSAADAKKSGVKVSSFTGYEEDGWPGVNKNISSWRVDMSEMILEDKPIPAVLARSVYAGEGFSDNVPITAIVERNIYAEEGRNIIIPAGSRVIGKVGGDGESSGGNSGGAVKIAISWTRLIRPDGSQFMFSSANTADAQGRSGAIGYLDEQLLKKYSMPLLTSMLQNATAYVMASGSGSKTTDTSSTTDARSQAAEDARQNFIQQMDRIFDEILERKANIRSVTYIPAGTRIIIFPNQDLWLNSEDREKKKSKEGGYNGNIEDNGLVNENAGEEVSGGNNVTYSGNYNENVTPASGGGNNNGGGGLVSEPNRNQPNGYGYPPAPTNISSPPVAPESSTTSSEKVPELI